MGMDIRAPRKIGPRVALGSIHSSCCSWSRWSARVEPEFFEVPISISISIGISISISMGMGMGMGKNFSPPPLKDQDDTR